MEPRLVSDVSPAYDCAACRNRLRKGAKTLSNDWVITCPEPQCRSMECIDLNTRTHVCSNCGHTWEPREADIYLEEFFSCARCYAPPHLARHNRAIVVAQKGLVDLVKHHKNAKAKQERDKAAEKG